MYICSPPSLTDTLYEGAYDASDDATVARHALVRVCVHI